MARQISLGDTVEVTLFNTAGSSRRKVRTGASFISYVLDIDYSPHMRSEWQRSHEHVCRWQVQVERPGFGKMWVWQYEVRRING